MQPPPMLIVDDLMSQASSFNNNNNNNNALSCCMFCGSSDPEDIPGHEKLCAHRRIACPRCRCEMSAKNYIGHTCRPTAAMHEISKCELCGGLRRTDLAGQHRLVCSYRTVKCNYCNESIVARDYLTHINMMCLARFTTCSDCGVRFSSDDIDRHRSAICMHCDQTVPECIIKRHIQSCPSARIACPYCGDLYPRAAIHEHTARCSTRQVCPECGEQIRDPATHPCTRSCPKCGDIVRVLDFKTHTEKECKTTCACGCGEAVLWIDVESKAHCNGGRCVVACPQCHGVILCTDRVDHLANSCPQRTVTCPLCDLRMRYVVLLVHSKWCSVKNANNQGVMGIVLDPECYVVDVRKDSPAMRAGFCVGDRLLRYEHHRLGVKGTILTRQDLARLMSLSTEGDHITIEVHRKELVAEGGRTYALSVMLMAPSLAGHVTQERIKALRRMRAEALGDDRGRTIRELEDIISNRSNTDSVIAQLFRARHHRGEVTVLGREMREFLGSVFEELRLVQIPMFTEEIHEAIEASVWYYSTGAAAAPSVDKMELTPEQCGVVTRVILRHILASLLEVEKEDENTQNVS
eukprot:PhM_4_TR11198/c0_g1_i1/m.63976